MVSHLYNISFIFLTSPFMVDFIVYIRVIRVIRSMDHPLCSFVIMSFCLKKIICLHLSLCHSVFKNPSVFVRSPVILSSRIPLSSSVPLLFCLKNSLCLYLSLCYSVSHLFCLYRVEKSWQWCVLGSGIKKGDMYKSGVCNYHVFRWL